jgi:hypothetical protein
MHRRQVRQLERQPPQHSGPSRRSTRLAQSSPRSSVSRGAPRLPWRPSPRASGVGLHDVEQPEAQLARSSSPDQERKSELLRNPSSVSSTSASCLDGSITASAASARSPCRTPMLAPARPARLGAGASKTSRADTQRGGATSSAAEYIQSSCPSDRAAVWSEHAHACAGQPDRQRQAVQLRDSDGNLALAPLPWARSRAAPAVPGPRTGEQRRSHWRRLLREAQATDSKQVSPGTPSRTREETITLSSRLAEPALDHGSRADGDWLGGCRARAALARVSSTELRCPVGSGARGVGK